MVRKRRRPVIMRAMHSHRLTQIGLIVLGIVVAAGCSSDDDATFPAGTGGKAGHAGSGGAAGTGGRTGSGGFSGSGGSSGTGGAGHAGAGGSGGTATGGSGGTAEADSGTEDASDSSVGGAGGGHDDGAVESSAGGAAGSGGTGGAPDAGQDGAADGSAAGAAGSGGATDSGTGGAADSSADAIADAIADSSDAATHGTPFGGTPKAFGTATTTQIEAENYDVGGEGISYHDTTPGNSGSYQTRTDSVDLGSSPTNITQIAAGEWTEYTINVTTAGDYSVQLGLASTSTQHMHIEVDGQDVSGPITINATSDAGVTFAAQPTSLTGGVLIHVTVGLHVMRWVYDDGNFSLNWIKFTQLSG
jgi:hypothetical protein